MNETVKQQLDIIEELQTGYDSGLISEGTFESCRNRAISILDFFMRNTQDKQLAR